jgi:protein TonB
MLGYAASAPRNAERRSSPNALLAIIAGHVALLAVVMSAKMDLPTRFHRGPPIIVDFVPRPVDPPPEPQATPLPIPRLLPAPVPTPFQPLPLPRVDGPTVTPGPLDLGPAIGGGGAATGSTTSPPIKFVPLNEGPRLLTPPSELRPPYPPSKLLSEEEATLKLRLSVDERGRVVAVDPVGRADAVFLAAARRHLVAHWRYKPATADGRAVVSSTVITLRFQLDG